MLTFIFAVCCSPSLPTNGKRHRRRGQHAIKGEQWVKAQEEAKEDARWRAEYGDPEDPWNQRLAHGQSLYNSDGSERLTPYYSLPVIFSVCYVLFTITLAGIGARLASCAVGRP